MSHGERPYGEWDDGSSKMTPELWESMSETERLAWRGLNAAFDLARDTAVAAGWYVDPETAEPKARNFGEVCMLMVTELSEAVEADRKSLLSDKLKGFLGQEEEFADCIIRQGDTARARRFDVATAYILKNRHNQTREDHKLANRALPGGKKY